MGFAEPVGRHDLTHDFKSAMRRLAATVTLITASSKGAQFGMAATAVSSLTTEPPALLICVNRSASINEPIHASKRFCVNILSCLHHDLVPLFSGKLSGEERFSAGEWGDGDGIPFLLDAQATIMCSVAESIEYGTHSVFIGNVMNVHLAGETRPLLFQEGAFCRSVGLSDLAH